MTNEFRAGEDDLAAIGKEHHVTSGKIMTTPVKSADPTKVAESVAAKANKATSQKDVSVTKKSSRQQDATAMLRADHKLVSGLFDEFEKAKSSEEKKSIVEQICTELTVHAQIEEEIFYPAFKEALKDHELVPEATVEHGSVKELIAQVQGVEPDGEIYDARVKVMGEFVKHHVKEEQNEMFPKAKSSGMDLRALGKQMQERKSQLMSERAGVK